jgi:hypothetical protein
LFGTLPAPFAAFAFAIVAAVECYCLRLTAVEPLEIFGRLKRECFPIGPSAV